MLTFSNCTRRLAPLMLAGAGFISAGPITYTFSTTATGTLGVTPFTGATLTITSIADTSTVVSYLSGPNLIYDNFPTTTTFTLAGFGTGTFAAPTFFEDPNGSGDIIFGVVTSNSGLAFCTNCDGLLGLTQLFAGLETYNLQSAIGPVSSAFDFESSVFTTFQNIPTSSGLLSLVGANDTFTASVPEPSSFLLGATGLLALLAIRISYSNAKSAPRAPVCRSHSSSSCD